MSDTFNSEKAAGAEHWYEVRHGKASAELKEETKLARKAEKNVARTAAEAAPGEADRLIAESLDKIYGARHAAEVLSAMGRSVPDGMAIPAKPAGFSARDVEGLKARIAADDLVLKTRGSL